MLNSIALAFLFFTIAFSTTHSQGPGKNDPPAEPKVLTKLTLPEPVRSCAYHPDGKSIFVAGGATVWRFDIATGKLLSTRNFLGGKGPETNIWSLTPLADGKSLAVLGGGPGFADQQLKRIDSSTGKDLDAKGISDAAKPMSAGFDKSKNVLKVLAANGNLLLVSVYRFPPGTKTDFKEINTRHMILSPDGSRLAHVINGNYVEIFDTTTGMKTHAFPVPFYDMNGKKGSVDMPPPYHEGAISPDNRFLTLRDGWNNVVVVDTFTREEVFHRQLPFSNKDGLPVLELRYAGQEGLRFSPDGTQIVVNERDSGTSFVLPWLDHSSGGKAKMQAIGKMNCAVHSPDGKQILVGAGTSLSIYDLGVSASKQVPLSPQALQSAWTDLQSKQNYLKGMSTLTAGKLSSLEYLKGKLSVSPYSPLDPTQLKQLISQLDADSYVTRVKATAALRSAATHEHEFKGGGGISKLLLEAYEAREKAAPGSGAEFYQRAFGGSGVFSQINDAQLSPEAWVRLNAIWAIRQEGSQAATALLMQLAGAYPAGSVIGNVLRNF